MDNAKLHCWGIQVSHVLMLNGCYVLKITSLWGGGFLYNMGVLDYSGGYVIHLSSGTAGK